MYEIFERLCKQNNVTPYAVAKATGITTSTMSSWKVGRYTPKADKLQVLADYFGVSLEYLATGKDSPKDSSDGTTYYFDDDTAQAAQDMFEDKNLRALMYAARGNTPENIKLATEMLLRFKETNPNG